MYNVKKVNEDLYWIGASDRRLALFENIYPIPRGVSYNSYVILDEQTVLLDTVDKSVSGQFFENLEHVLGNRPLDYMIVNHMEPDHCAIVEEVVRRFPEVKVVGNAKTFNMMKQFFTFDVDAHAVVIKEGDTISTGKHTLAFAMIPMVHWPEAMVTYDAYDKVLFSADAFGTFGALNGNVFADEVNFKEEWLDDARRYLRDLLDIKVYVEADADERILRRIIRDVKERGRDMEGVVEQYLTTVKPIHYLYVEPTRCMADIVINSGKNPVAFTLVKNTIQKILDEAE